MGLRGQTELNGPADRQHRRASLLFMAASGFAGLGYQIVWTQQCALWLGHESAAVLAVVAAFFGGLALGAFTLGAGVARSARPLRWYAGCEVTIALWSLLLMAVMRPVSAWALRMTGTQPAPVWQWAVAFFATFVLFLPATAAMGATLPAMERVVARAPRRSPGQSIDSHRFIAALYAANTFGAVAGVLAGAFALVPGVGLARTAGVSVALNLLCAAGALALFPARAPIEPAAPAPALPAADRAGARGALIRLALTGLLGIGFEVLIVRVLSEVTEDTVYTFALLLAVYLVGTAAGAAGYQRRLARQHDPEQLTDPLIGALAVACIAGTASLWGAAVMKAAVSARLVAA